VAPFAEQNRYKTAGILKVPYIWSLATRKGKRGCFGARQGTWTSVHVVEAFLEDRDDVPQGLTARVFFGCLPRVVRAQPSLHSGPSLQCERKRG
jgi:hypothetical protein